METVIQNSANTVLGHTAALYKTRAADDCEAGTCLLINFLLFFFFCCAQMTSLRWKSR